MRARTRETVKHVEICDMRVLMSAVLCTIDFVFLPNEHFRLVESTFATCAKCRHSTQSFGTSNASVRRCLALMREECPAGEDNFYVSESSMLENV